MDEETNEISQNIEDDQQDDIKKYGTPSKKTDPNLFTIRNDKATKRIIAPYVNIVRRGKRAALSEKDRELEFFFEGKPSIIGRNINEFLDDTVDLPTVLLESVATLKSITKSAGSRLYMVNEDLQEYYCCPRNNPNPERKIGWAVQEGSTVAGYVAARKEYVMIGDVLTDARFPEGVPFTDPTVKAVLAVPVVTPTNECLAVIELYRDVLQPNYDRNDLKIAVVIAGWIGTSIHLNKERMTMQRNQKLNECLMNLTKCYFAGTITLGRMINEVASFAKQVIDAEKATFYILNREDMTADIYDEALTGNSMLRRQLKANFNKEQSIASNVAKTGHTINIQNSFKDYRSRRDLNSKTAFIERSVLAMPIMGVEGVLGVVEAVNKIGEECFTRTDEEVFRTFTLYCALALYYSKIVDARQRADTFSDVIMSLLKRHLEPCEHDINDMKENLEFDEPLSNVNDFGWYITPERVNELPQIVYYMMTHVGEPEFFDSEELMKFILSVRIFYRKNPYHNFEHAFSVCHCMYNILKRNIELYTVNERNSLLLAALCHDIDHGGITNSFLHLNNDPLSRLYADAPWENHHFCVTMLLLGEIHIYQNISKSDHKSIQQIISNAILATDLSVYFRTRAKIAPIVEDDTFDWNNPQHRTMLIDISMTTCDLSGNCKPFPVAKKIADNLYEEFYKQGDIERSMGYTPLSTMDRLKQYNIPEDQVEFLSVLVIPACDLLRKCFPNTSPLYDEACNLRDDWWEVIRIRNERCWNVEEVLGTDILMAQPRI
ncbi:cAMP and cAMP-inhibited cGMP 3',5'-cyclic phosphodiesterase 10A-like [Onthophagus taurus]|uniref:cAMP and cAMP-inhibited cGMP 3',5'-cyclic phosphodiesterase 10A-like n=1 Tax=Onthophagus taurus TaxID=166361 RepID=UPI000C20CD93|nr:cAMP and cAMP-inhibited cGMP 3',5'-cyclic phosphodiesterase 10A-like [Onthophagus taurus]